MLDRKDAYSAIPQLEKKIDAISTAQEEAGLNYDAFKEETRTNQTRPREDNPARRLTQINQKRPRAWQPRAPAHWSTVKLTDRGSLTP